MLNWIAAHISKIEMCIVPTEGSQCCYDDAITQLVLFLHHVHGCLYPFRLLEGGGAGGGAGEGQGRGRGGREKVSTEKSQLQQLTNQNYNTCTHKTCPDADN